MKRLYRLYIFSVSGALGGVIASWLHQFYFVDTLATALNPSTRYLYLAYLGVVIGIPIGFLPTYVEGRGNYSLRGAIRTGLTGAVLGGLSGAVALPLAEWVHLGLGGGMKGRVTAWMLFGTFVGVFVGIAEGRVGGARPWRGMFGGAICAGVRSRRTLKPEHADVLSISSFGAMGNLIALSRAGALRVLPTHLSRVNGYFAQGIIAAARSNDSAILALLLLGFFIALSIALFVNVLSDAWLEGQPGSKVQGRIYHLGKFREPHQAIIGSDKSKAVFIYIQDAQAEHAGITLTRRGARLRHLAQNGVTRVNGATVKERMLRDGEFVEIGSARLKYRERRRTTTAPAAPAKMPTG